MNFVEAAQTIALTEKPEPKQPSQWRYIGKEYPRVDIKPKTNGEAIYTIDAALPDMLTCAIARPSRFGAKVKSFDPAPALAINGVAEVVATPIGVAVLAEGYRQGPRASALYQLPPRGRRAAARRRWPSSPPACG